MIAHGDSFRGRVGDQHGPLIVAETRLRTKKPYRKTSVEHVVRHRNAVRRAGHGAVHHPDLGADVDDRRRGVAHEPGEHRRHEHGEEHRERDPGRQGRELPLVIDEQLERETQGAGHERVTAPMATSRTWSFTTSVERECRRSRDPAARSNRMSPPVRYSRCSLPPLEGKPQAKLHPGGDASVSEGFNAVSAPRARDSARNGAPCERFGAARAPNRSDG
jgi:hypothetical protein